MIVITSPIPHFLIEYRNKFSSAPADHIEFQTQEELEKFIECKDDSYRIIDSVRMCFDIFFQKPITFGGGCAADD